MSVIEKKIIDIPFVQCNEIDASFRRQMKLDTENIPSKFSSFFEKTQRDSFAQLTMRGIYESHDISEISDDQVKLKNGVVLESDMLARAFHRSSALVFYVIGASGYEALDEAEENMVSKLFLDSWGTAIVSYGSLALKRLVRKELYEHSLHSTFSFSPGQHNVPMDVQQVIFHLLQPEQIGVTLNNHFLMHPKKSVSGIFGIGAVKDEEGLRPCDFCSLRDNCASAYGEDEWEA